MVSFKKELYNSILAYQTYPPGLMLGKTGLCFFLTSERSRRNLAISQEIIDTLNSDLTLFRGFAISSGTSGFYLLLKYLKKCDLLDDGFQTNMSFVDEICDFGLNRYISGKNFDYLHGYLGIYNTFIYNIPSKQVQQNPQHFYNSSFDNILGFLDPQNPVFPFDKNIDQTRYLANMGLAHGIPSILSVLINHHKVFPSKENLKTITAIVDFILSKKRNACLLQSKFSSVLKKDNNREEEKESRLAWCYGDLGVNLCLLKASIVVGDNVLEQNIVGDLITTCKRRTYEETSVIDCSFCHGAAGLVYYYKKLYNRYKIFEFKDAYEYWERFILTRYNSHGIKGLNTFYGAKGWTLEYGILEGLIGIYLAFFDEDFDCGIFDYIFLTDF